ISIIAVLATSGYFFVMPLVLRFWGLNPPEIETTETVTNFLQKNGAQYDVLAVPRDMKDFKMLNNNMGVPGVICFNKQMQPIKSSHGEGCPTTARKFAGNLDATNYPVDSTNLSNTNLSDFINAVNIID